METAARILRITVEYKRETFYNKLGKVFPDSKRKEILILDGENETLECYQDEDGISCM